MITRSRIFILLVEFISNFQDNYQGSNSYNLLRKLGYVNILYGEFVVCPSISNKSVCIKICLNIKCCLHEHYSQSYLAFLFDFQLIHRLNVY